MTNVHLQFTGEIWDRMRGGHLDYAFEGNTLGELLNSLFAQHEIKDLILDSTGKIRTRSRIAINGRFSDTLQGMETPVADNDLVVLMRPGLGAS